jgi:exosortase A-associated hydrolase 2
MERNEAFYFSAQDKRLFGFLHEPETQSAAGSISVLICHPLGEEKQITHRRLVECARELASRGVRVLRFDFYGSGDSEGEAEEPDLDRWHTDIGSAAHWLRQRYPETRIGALGLRLGATLAALFAEQHPEALDFLALWSPVVDGRAFVERLCRQMRLTQVRRHAQGAEEPRDGEWLEFGGLRLSPQQRDQIGQVDLRREKRFVGPVLVVHFASNRSERSQMDDLMGSYHRSASCELRVVDDRLIWLPVGAWEYDECASELNQQTRTWLEKVIGIHNGRSLLVQH